eukprot:TRINITY_DN3910_c0_g1_i2.p2 TRINITY_DN3910_c0_g1~~TRINITY_DN3910_c0_g1_i2.p2  ORF type:complete len:202 (+),score=37.49 TRINITY_DN3910_c0_g1_i2:129-734(+)
MSYFSRYALLVIDMNGQHKAVASSILKSLNYTVSQLRKRNTPICFTQWQYNSQMPEEIATQYILRLSRFQHLDTGLQDWQLLPELNLSAKDRIFDQKSAMDAFSDDRLDPYLEDNEVQGVIISGVETQTCCLETAKGAQEKGYDVVMLSDGMAAASKKEHEKALQEAEKFARIMTCEEAVQGYYLVGDDEIKTLRQQTATT